MSRIAGDSTHYEIAAIDASGHAVGRTAKLPSVTTILKVLHKDGLDWWGYRLGLNEGRVWSAEKDFQSLDEEAFYEQIKKLGREGEAQTPHTVLKASGGRGTDAHDIAEHLFTKGKMLPKDKIGEDRLPYAEALWDWYKSKARTLEVVAVEIPVFSLVHFYAGTLDLVLKSAAGYHVVDFKTSKGIYESHLLQVTAYDYAARERGLIPVDEISTQTVVRLGANGKWEMKNSYHTIEDFLAVKSVWQMLQQHNGKVA